MQLIRNHREMLSDMQMRMGDNATVPGGVVRRMRLDDVDDHPGNLLPYLEEVMPFVGGSDYHIMKNGLEYLTDNQFMRMYYTAKEGKAAPTARHQDELRETYIRQVHGDIGESGPTQFFHASATLAGPVIRWADGLQVSRYAGAQSRGKRWLYCCKNRTTPLRSYGGGGLTVKHSKDLLPFEDNEGRLIWKEIKIVYGLRSLRDYPYAEKVDRGRSLLHQFQLGPGEFETYWIEFHCIKGQRIDRRVPREDGTSYFSGARVEVKSMRGYTTKLRKAWELMQFYDQTTRTCSVMPPAWRSRADTQFNEDGHDPDMEYYVDLIEKLAEKPIYFNDDDVDAKTHELLDRYHAFMMDQNSVD